MNKKLAKTSVVVFLLAALCVSLVACNNAKFKISNIYESSSSPGEIDGYKQEFALPANWSVYTTSKTSSSSSADNVNSDVGYIKELDAFVVKYSGPLGEGLSIVKCNDKKVYFNGAIPGMLFPSTLGIASLRYKDGLIAVKFSNGEAGVFDSNGKTVLSRSAVSGVGAATINSAIKILDGGLIAVNRLYCGGPSKTTAIFRPSYNGENADRKELVCYVANDGEKLDYVDGFDGDYVSVTGNENVWYMFSVPAAKSSQTPVLSGGNSGKISANDEDDYFCEITYIGGGRFLVHEDWTVDASADYTYNDGNDYYVVSRHVYSPKTDTMSDYGGDSNIIFLNLTNKYYSEAKGGIDVHGFLKDGYMYAPYGLFIVDKVAYYDQYILNADLEVAASLTDNLGVSLRQDKTEDISYFDLIIDVVDGYAYVPYLPSNMHVYDNDGHLVASNTTYTVLTQFMSDGLILANVVDPEDKEETLWGAFDLQGNVAVPFIYTTLTPFRGYYAIGKRVEDGAMKIFLVGKDGKEVTSMSDGSVPLADIAKADTSVNGSIYKNGCYMYAEKVDGVNYYGIKNFNANTRKNVVMPARMAVGSFLYAPSAAPENIFVFEKITNADSSVSFTIYRMTSKTVEAPEDKLGAIIGGTVGGVLGLAVIVIVVLLVLKKRGIIGKKNSVEAEAFAKDGVAPENEKESGVKAVHAKTEKNKSKKSGKNGDVSKASDDGSDGDSLFGGKKKGKR